MRCPNNWYQCWFSRCKLWVFQGKMAHPCQVGYSTHNLSRVIVYELSSDVSSLTSASVSTVSLRWIIRMANGQNQVKTIWYWLVNMNAKCQHVNHTPSTILCAHSSRRTKWYSAAPCSNLSSWNPASLFYVEMWLSIASTLALAASANENTVTALPQKANGRTSSCRLCHLSIS